MDIDLPTGNDTGGGDHLVQFLLTLKELVDVLGRTGPGGPSAGGSTGEAADQTGGKNLVKATQKLFNDLAAAFKPLKTVLATFGTIQPQQAAAPAAPLAVEAPAVEEDKPKGKGRKKKDDDETPTEKAPVAAITVQDASIGIDYASVKMPAPPAPKNKTKQEPEPEPEKEPEPLLAKLVDIDTNLVKITVPTASFKITSALLQGKFYMPPEAADAKPAPGAKPETTPKEKTDKAPGEKKSQVLRQKNLTKTKKSQQRKSPKKHKANQPPHC